MRNGKERILMVDDEPRYTWAIQKNLRSRGYEVMLAGDGSTAVEMAASEDPDLILLDLMMPGMDGYEACQHIREFSTVPIIMLTARAANADKVRGLDTGADDYVTKPFSIEELLARIRAALRRGALAEGQVSQPSFQAGELLVDFAGQRVYVGATEVHLTPTEYQLLAALIKESGKVLTPDSLLERVWGPGYEADNHLLRQAIHRLRQKIEPDPHRPRYIVTRPGLGYVFLGP